MNACHGDDLVTKWPSRDPIGYAGGLNLYTLVQNNSVNLFDPLGEASACDRCNGGCPQPKCKVRAGPSFSPSGTIRPIKEENLGRLKAKFSFTASFEDDPSKGSCAGCCEIRLEIKWTQPTPPTDDFKGKLPNTWYEDVDGGKHYGHRNESGFIGSNADEEGADIYFDTVQDNSERKCGKNYFGRDRPKQPIGTTGTFTYRLSVVDMCDLDINGKPKDVGSKPELIVDWSNPK